MKVKKHSKVYRIKDGLFYFLGLVVFVAFAVMTIWGNEGLVKLINLREQRSALLQTNHQLLKENLLFLEEINALKKARYVEQTARSKMGLIRKDEVVFVVR